MLDITFTETAALLAADVNPSTFRGWRADGTIPGLVPGPLNVKALLTIAVARELSLAGVPRNEFGRMASSVVDSLIAQPDELARLIHSPVHELRAQPLLVVIWRDAAGAFQHILARSATLTGTRQYSVISLPDIVGPVMRRANDYSGRSAA